MGQGWNQERRSLVKTQQLRGFDQVVIALAIGGATFGECGVQDDPPLRRAVCSGHVHAQRLVVSVEYKEHLRAVVASVAFGLLASR